MQPLRFGVTLPEATVPKYTLIFLGEVMNVETIMSKPVASVGMDDSLKTIKELLDKTHFHHLLVIESNELVGVISDRDLLKALSPNLGTAMETAKDTEILNKKAHQIMTRKPITLVPLASIHRAIEIFCNNNISCIPVVDDKNKPVGIISWRDVIKEFGKTMIEEAEL